MFGEEITTVGQFIDELNKLPEELPISFQSYYESFSAKVCWDITLEDYKEGCTDEPYVYLTSLHTK